VTPDAMVALGSIVTVGWYAFDPRTGMVTDTMEDGRHQDEIEYGALLTQAALLSIPLKLVEILLNSLCTSEHESPSKNFREVVNNMIGASISKFIEIVGVDAEEEVAFFSSHL